MSPAPPLPRLPVVLVLLALAVAYALRLSYETATAWDDGFYLVLGKSLATGQGYRVINLPKLPFECALPPGYPLLLALGWWVWPAYPQNLMLMKGLNVVSGLVAVVATYCLTTGTYGASRAKGLVTAGLLAVNAVILLYLDITMAEVVYVAAATLGMIACERLLAPGERLSLGRLLLVAAIAAVPSFLRSLGLALGCGVAGVLFQRRQWKALALYLPAMGLMQLPWQAWIYWRMHSGAPYYFDYAGWVKNATGGNKLSAFVASTSHNATELVTGGFTSFLLPGLTAISHGRHLAPLAPVLWALVLFLTAVGLYRTARPAPKLFHWYLLAYFAVIVPFPWPPTRYAAATAPVLLYALVEGIWWLGGEAAPWHAWTPARWLGRGGAAGMLLAVSGWGVVALVQPHPGWGNPDDPALREARAIRQLVAATPPDAAVMYVTGFEVFLLTGRQGLQWWPEGTEAAETLRQNVQDAAPHPVYALVRSNGPALPPGLEPMPGAAVEGLALYRVAGQP